jgi:hypothetical protein
VQRALVGILGVGMLFAAVSPAHAQTESRFAIGAELTIAASNRAPGQDEGHSATFPEVLWRFGDIEPGFGPHWGLDWYSLDIDRVVGPSSTTLGELHVRPILAGYGYTWIRDKNAISVNLLGGYAFGSISLQPAAADAYRTHTGFRPTGIDASNTFVLRPEIDIWHDINRLFGLNVNIGYMIARPTVAITTSAGIDKRTARADQLQVRIGLVYSIF